MIIVFNIVMHFIFMSNINDSEFFLSTVQYFLFLNVTKLLKSNIIRESLHSTLASRNRSSIESSNNTNELSLIIYHLVFTVFTWLLLSTSP